MAKFKEKLIVKLSKPKVRAKDTVTCRDTLIIQAKAKTG